MKKPETVYNLGFFEYGIFLLTAHNGILWSCKIPFEDVLVFFKQSDSNHQG